VFYCNFLLKKLIGFLQYNNLLLCNLLCKMADISNMEQLQSEISGLKAENNRLMHALMSKEIDLDGNIHASVPITSTGEKCKVMISENLNGEKVFKVDLPDTPPYSLVKQLETENPIEALQQVQGANARYHRLNQDLIKRVQTQAKTIKGLLEQTAVLEEHLQFIDKMGFITEIKRLKEENAKAIKNVEHMEAHCKESSAQLELMRKEAKSAKDEIREAGKLKLVEAGVRAQKSLKAAHDVQSELRVELAAANAKIAQLEDQILKDNTAMINDDLVKKIGELMAQNSAQSKENELKLNTLYSEENSLKKQITVLEKHNSELQTQVIIMDKRNFDTQKHRSSPSKLETIPESVHELYESQEISKLQAKNADLMKKIKDMDDVERSLNAALHLHFSEAKILKNNLTQHIEALKSELNTIKVKKITEANEHTAFLSHMLYNASYMQQVSYAQSSYEQTGYAHSQPVYNQLSYINPSYVQSS